MKLMFSSQLYFILIMAIGCKIASADEVSDMQKRLNEEVMGKLFSVETEANLNAYIEEATKRGIPPKTTPSRYWRRGYTCGDLRRYSWSDYRDCSYFYRYYGYYWPY
ncbi:hypothetical protein [Methylomonas sp. MgM2]